MNPYPGLERRLYGRAGDVRVAVSNAVVSRWTVIYGLTGAGKSALLQHGLARSLRDRGRHYIDWRSWRGRDDRSNEDLDELRVNGRLSLREVAALNRPAVVMIDQFEELLIQAAHGHVAGEAARRALEDLVEVVCRPNGRVNVTVALRDDDLVRLADLLDFGLSEVLSNLIRLDLLPLEGAKEAVKEPFSISERRDLPEEFVVRLADEVAKLTEADEKSRWVHPKYLSIATQRYWELYEKAGRRLDFDFIGAVDEFSPGRALEAFCREYLDEAFGGANRDQAAQVLRHLADKTGVRKIARETRELENLVPEWVSSDDVAGVLGRLREDGKIVLCHTRAGRSQYELEHDLFAQPVLEWVDGVESSGKVTTFVPPKATADPTMICRQLAMWALVRSAPGPLQDLTLAARLIVHAWYAAGGTIDGRPAAENPGGAAVEVSLALMQVLGFIAPGHAAEVMQRGTETQARITLECGNGGYVSAMRDGQFRAMWRAHLSEVLTAAARSELFVITCGLDSVPSSNRMREAVRVWRLDTLKLCLEFEAGRELASQLALPDAAIVDRIRGLVRVDPMTDAEATEYASGSRISIPDSVTEVTAVPEPVVSELSVSSDLIGEWEG